MFPFVGTFIVNSMIQDQIEPQLSEPFAEGKLRLDTLYGQARLQFIQKVFTVLSVQIACIAGMLLLTVFKPEFCAFQQSHTMLLIVFLVGWVGGYVVLVYGQVARKYPHSLVLTCIYTVSQAYCVSYICGGYLVPAHNSTILVAAIMTLCVVAGCAIYAYKTETDFTTNQGAKVTGIITCAMLVVFGLFDNVELISTLLCALGAGLYGMYLIISIQLMIGNNERQLSIDDHVICAVMLSTNVLQLFTCVLMLFGGRNAHTR